MSEKIKKPPDINPINQNVFRIIKCPLKSVLKEYDKLHPIIDNCVKDINQFVIIGYQFIRLYLLDKFNKNEDLPIVDKQFILDVLKTIGKSETNRGKQKTEDKIINKDTKDSLKIFYDNVFSKIIPEKLSYTNKTHILEQISKEMITCLETNISTHFIKHLFKYINCVFKEPKTKIIKQEKDKEKRKELYKELNEDLRNLKSDLINNKKTLSEAQIIAESIINVRNLVNTPPSHMFPAVFAEYVKRTFKRNSKVSVEILDEKALKKKGYGAIIGVGQGSINPPRFVKVTYKPRGAKFHLALVGKGITFDTGGISLKPPASMHTMKCDMAGAATVVETLRAIANLDLKINVSAYAALAENMPSATAQRPSDVVTTYGGKTIEVLNTDAEGRLVLADALGKAQEDKPDFIVDVATLTGAATIALGSKTAGIMSNKDDARDQVFQCAKETGELMWPMQIPEESRTILDSKTADIANVGFTPNPAGGMMVGAAFLNEFVDEKYPWVHIDIAPPAFNEGNASGYTSFGGTGIGVRTLVNLAQKFAK